MINFARALARESEVWCFDEATSNLDSKNEEIVN
jgi:ABC-type multidrug transport system fused ATPase/permease subunit